MLCSAAGARQKSVRPPGTASVRSPWSGDRRSTSLAPSELTFSVFLLPMTSGDMGAVRIKTGASAGEPQGPCGSFAGFVCDRLGHLEQVPFSQFVQLPNKQSVLSQVLFHILGPQPGPFVPHRVDPWPPGNTFLPILYHRAQIQKQASSLLYHLLICPHQTRLL